jgi:hypothetical protein
MKAVAVLVAFCAAVVSYNLIIGVFGQTLAVASLVAFVAFAVATACRKQGES